MNRMFAVAALVTAMFGSTIGTALAAGDPSISGTGQPGQTCLSSTAPSEPGNAASAPGSAFNENGGIAGSVYAGNGVSATTSGSGQAVSQYDVACYQVSH